MAPTKVAELTTDELRELVREVVLQTFAELLGDPDEGLELRPEFAAEAQRSLDAVQAGAPTTPIQEVAERLGMPLPDGNDNTQLSPDEFEALADQLADEFMKYVDPDCPPLSDYAVSRAGLYEDHL